MNNPDETEDILFSRGMVVRWMGRVRVRGETTLGFTS
jgi:hypothetical protein